MATVIDDQFAADVAGWSTIGVASAVSWDSGEAPGIDADGTDQAGRMIVSSSDASERMFASAIASGFTRLDFWVNVPDSTTGASSDDFVYLDYASSGTAVSSAASAFAFEVSRLAGDGATATYWVPKVRNSSAFVATTPLARSQWHKISAVVNISAHTYDFYVNDQLWFKAVACPNGAFTQLTRIAVASNASAPDCYISNVLVTSDWALPTETLLVSQDFTAGSGAISASTPTNTRVSTAQPWHVPADSSLYGGFTLGANGAAPDAATTALALTRCLAEGIVEVEFKTSVAGVRYIGIIGRSWDFPTATNGGSFLFRVSSTDNTIKLFINDASGVQQTVQSGSLSLSANTTYTLKVEMRGRVYICSYKAADRASGSYTVAFTHTVISSATGARGMLSEENFGPLVSTTIGATDNYVRGFYFTGAVPSTEVNKTVEDSTYNIGAGSIRSLYLGGGGLPTRDLGWSKGLCQFSHRSAADGVCALRQQIVINATNVLAMRQKTQNMSEAKQVGWSDSWVTLLARGPVVSDGCHISDTGENYAPDMDFRPEIVSADFKWVNNAGTVADASDLPVHDWSSLGTGLGTTLGYQSLTAYGSGQEYTIDAILSNVLNASAGWKALTKYEGNSDPISRTFAIDSVSAQEYRTRRSHLIRQASALSSTQLQNFRGDSAFPAVITFNTGTLKTDASGDTNTDGYNDRHGWYEITCDGSGEIDISVAVGSYTRYGLAFRLWSYSLADVTVTIAGSAGAAGTDYLLDDLGDGTAILQLLSDRAADTTIVLMASTGSRRRRALICGRAA